MSYVSDSSLRVIIVGAGFCGLTTAIECKLRGLHPIVVEAYPGPSSHGDLLDFTPNAGNVFNSWDDGKVGAAMLATSVNRAKYLEFYNQKNELLRADPWPQDLEALGTFAGHRGEFHKAIYEYAQRIGVEIKAGQKVVKYMDDERYPSVITASGETISGDVLLAADGPKSLARSHLLKLPESKVNSGYAIYRAFFRLTDDMKSNPIVAALSREHEDVTRFWVGRDMHGFIYTWNHGR